MRGFSSADGIRLAYHLEGEGEPLVCLPGGPMRASAYLGDLGGLAAHRRLVKLDLRGTGGSAVPADRTTHRCDRQVDDVEGLRLHLGLERIDLLAHSAAGDLAILYAARHPERVRSLVLLTARGRALGVDFTTGHRPPATGWKPPASGPPNPGTRGRGPRSTPSGAERRTTPTPGRIAVHGGRGWDRLGGAWPVRTRAGFSGGLWCVMRG